MSTKVRLEGLLLTADAQLLCVMNQVLDNLAIETEVCTDSASAMAAVNERKLDTVILDWTDPEKARETLMAVRKSGPNRKSTVVAMVNGAPDMQAAARMGANFMVPKPSNFEQLTRCFHAAYAAMLLQRRCAARYPVDIQVVANVAGTCNTEAMITDLSVGGLALKSEQALQVGAQVSFGFILPATTDLLHIAGTVVNTDGKHRTGLCFTYVPEKELSVLEKWLAAQFAKCATTGIP
jgi:CheY-like chemotaxis protein